MAGMEIVRILKKWGYLFQVYSFCLGKLAKILIMVFFALVNSLDTFLLAFHKYFVYGKGT